MENRIPTSYELPYQPEKDTSDLAQEDILRLLRKITYYMDQAFRIPFINYRVGLDSVIGLVPGIGDAVGTILSLYIVAQAVRFGIPAPLVARMLYNVILDTLVGSVPVLGDLFDAAWKANVKNLDLLEGYLREKKP